MLILLLCWKEIGLESRNLAFNQAKSQFLL